MRSNMLFWALFLITVTGVSTALEQDAGQPIEIEADIMTLDELHGTARYEGNVRLTQGSINVTADVLVLTNHNGKLQRMHIKGNQDRPAAFSQKTEAGQLTRGQAQQMEFDVGQSRLILSGRAELKQGSNFISSERIEYNTVSNSLLAGKQTDNTTAEPGEGRVHIVITPEKN